MGNLAPTRSQMAGTLLAAIVVVVLMTGCAGTAGTVRPAGAAERALHLDPYRHLTLQVTRAETVAVSDSEMERIARRVVEAIWAKQPDRFKEINAKLPTDPAEPTLDVTLRLTRYEKGSASARAIMAGLGRIHIGADVTLRDRARNETLGEYEVTKTFAWGGFYGATTDIEDVELGFAEGVASLLLGHPSQ